MGLLLILSVQAISQDLSLADSIKTYLERTSHFGYSGCVLVEKEGEVLVQDCFGDQNNMDRNARFPIASVSKQFTSALILAMEMDGKLTIEDSLVLFYPTLKGTEMAGISLKELMNHTSGLVGEYGTEKNYSREELLEGLFCTKLVSRPGEKYAYSNAGYNLLAATAEIVGNRPFQELMKERIFKPAGLGSTGFVSEKEVMGDENPNSWNVIGASGIYSTIGDMHRWMKTLDGEAILNASATEKLFTPEKKNYALGWKVANSKLFGKVIYHGGDISGYQSEIRWYRDRRVVLVYLDNCEMRSAVVNKVLLMPLGRKINLPPEIREKGPGPEISGRYGFEGEDSFFEVSQVDDHYQIYAMGQRAISALQGMDEEENVKVNSLARYTNGYWEKIAAGDFSYLLEKFSDRIPDEAVEEYMVEEWDMLLEKNGPFKRVNSLGVSRSPRSTNYAYSRLIFENDSILYRTEWSDGEITGINSEMELGSKEKILPVFSQLYWQGGSIFFTYDIKTQETYWLNFSADLSFIDFENQGKAERVK